jgi:hypothetical protein
MCPPADQTGVVSAPPVPEVTITIHRTVPITKTLTPAQPVAMSYTHPNSSPSHSKPHGVKWVAAGLQAGERIEIRLSSSFPGYEVVLPFKHEPWWEYLKSMFPNAEVLASGAFGFSLTSQAPERESGDAKAVHRFNIKKSGPGNRPLIHYEIVFYDAAENEYSIDPDIDVEPDP